jgi:hypothetical protein
LLIFYYQSFFYILYYLMSNPFNFLFIIFMWTKFKSNN